MAFHVATPSTDPWDWTVNEVIDQLHHQALLDPYAIESFVRRNSINGQILLQHVTADILDDELEPDIAERNTVSFLTSIRKFKKTSARYAHYCTTLPTLRDKIGPRVQMPSPAPSPTTTLVDPRSPVNGSATLQDLAVQHRSATDQSTANSRQSICLPRSSELVRYQETPPPEGETRDDTGNSVKRRRLNQTSLQRVKEIQSTRRSDDADHSSTTRVMSKRRKQFVRGPLAFYWDIDGTPYGSPGWKSPNFELVLRHDIPNSTRHEVYSAMIRLFVSFNMYQLVCHTHEAPLRNDARGRAAAEEFLGGIALEPILDDDMEYADNHEWDYILARWHDDGIELPCYGESGSENFFSDACLDEIELDNVEARPTSQLSTDEIYATIEGAICELELRWQKEKLPRRQAKAWSIWRKGLKNDRSNLIRVAEDRIQHLESRAGTMTCDIARDEWKSRTKLIRLCSSFEGTVFEKQDQTFMIGVWQASHPPEKPSKTSRPARPVRANVVGSDSDVEILESESDEFMDDDDDETPDVYATDSPSRNTASRYVNSEIVAALDPHGAPHPAGASSYQDYNLPDVADTELRCAACSPVTYTCTKSPDPTSSQRTLENLSSSSSRRLSQTLANVDSDPVSPNIVIDLTLSPSPSVKRRLSTPPNLDAIVSASVPAVRVWGSRPEEAPAAEIDSWTWEELELNNDRKRILIKILRAIEARRWNRLQSYLRENYPHDLQSNMVQSLEALAQPSSEGVRIYFHGLDQSDRECSKLVAQLYLCWTFVDHFFWERKQVISADSLKSTVASDDKLYFLKFLSKLFNRKSKIEPKEPQASSHVSLSASDKGTNDDRPTLSVQAAPDAFECSDEDKDVVSSQANAVPGSGRKRRCVKPDLGAQQKRAAAFERQAKGEASKQKLVLNMGLSFTSETGNVMINAATTDAAPIFINKFISAQLKPHQIDGVQFMWRELIAPGDDAQGCLLAHTMGLGKTMQTITLLVTVAEAGKSQDRAIKEQVPERLRRSRTLVLCPASLVENWKAEFKKWIEPGFSILGYIVDVSSTTPQAERSHIIDVWYHEHGVLIMGYEMYRTLTKQRSNRDVQLYPHVVEQLRDGPKIVITDEAHKLKNVTSEIGRAVLEFSTATRIALTGSPLANHLSDYYAMINFVAPGYLGGADEFRSYYQVPIVEGLYIDSTAYARRKSMKKLLLLKTNIEPKVHRADISVLKHNLKPKTEFVIKLALTPLQLQQYVLFVKSLQDDTNELSNTKLWAWLKYLHLLCCHPTVFVNFMKFKIEEKKTQERQEKKMQQQQQQQQARDKIDQNSKKSKTQSKQGKRGGFDAVRTQPESGTANDAENGEPVPLVAAGMSERQMKLYEESDIAELLMSYKVGIIAKILEESKKINDQVLVFSHHLPVLDYLERYIERALPGLDTLRIDGKTPSSARLSMTQAVNRGRHDVVLLSTKAGGLGLNITGANRVIIADFSWTPADEEQAIGRAYRLGQEKPVYVYHLVSAGTFEEAVHNKAIFKKQLAYRVVDQKKPERMAMSNKDYLFIPGDVEQEDLSEHAGRDGVLDAVVESELGRCIRSLTTEETLHRETYEVLTAEDEQDVDDWHRDEALRIQDPAAFRMKHPTSGEGTEEPRRAGGSTTATPRQEQMRWLFPESHAGARGSAHSARAR